MIQRLLSVPLAAVFALLMLFLVPAVAPAAEGGDPSILASVLDAVLEVSIELGPEADFSTQPAHIETDLAARSTIGEVVTGMAANDNDSTNIAAPDQRTSEQVRENMVERIRIGTFAKGGLNDAQITPRPSPPIGQRTAQATTSRPERPEPLPGRSWPPNQRE